MSDEFDLNDDVTSSQDGGDAPEDDVSETETDSGNVGQPQEEAPLQPQQNYAYSWQGDAASGGKKPKKSGIKIFIACASVCLAIVLVMLAVVSSFGMNGTPSQIGDESSRRDEVSYQEFIKKTTSDGDALDYTEIYSKCSPSCLSVITDVALGSGFVIDTDGHVMTNHHVIDDAKSIKVQFYDGTEYEAELVGSDSVSDIAVLKIEATGLTPIDIGDSDNVVAGESVSAIGTPYDISLAGTITPGIISGIARDVEVTNDYGTVVKTMTLLQTSTPINPGNSGGPLINAQGQVIGITTLKMMDVYEGLGFAIPINSAVQIANMILTYGEVTSRPDNDFVTATAKLNITVMNIADAVSQGVLESADGLPEGALVYEVSRVSAIYKAGLELYDIITEFDGVKITSKETLVTELKKHSAGETVTVKVYRANRLGSGGTTETLEFKLDSAS